jgi:hypothetical protein
MRLLSLAWLMFAALLPGAVRADATRDVELALLAADQARLEALFAADTAALGPILGEDLTYGHATGQVQTKAELIAAVASGGIRYVKADSLDKHARGFGCAGVVTAIGGFTFEARGQPLRLTLRYTATYALRDGRWQLVAYQSTPVPEAAARTAVQAAGSNLSTTPLMQ